MARLHFSQFNPSGVLSVSGSLNVKGNSTFEHSGSAVPLMTVSGSINVTNALTAQTGSLSINSLGTFGPPSTNLTVDLSSGDDF